jgi:hypothetical protein
MAGLSVVFVSNPGGPGKPKHLNVQMGLRSFGAASFGYSALEQQGAGMKSIQSPVDVQSTTGNTDVPKSLEAEIQVSLLPFFLFKYENHVWLEL